jgi:hypothetical protein
VNGPSKARKHTTSISRTHYSPDKRRRLPTAAARATAAPVITCPDAIGQMVVQKYLLPCLNEPTMDILGPPEVLAGIADEYPCHDARPRFQMVDD